MEPYYHLTNRNNDFNLVQQSSSRRSQNAICIRPLFNSHFIKAIIQKTLKSLQIAVQPIPNTNKK